MSIPQHSESNLVGILNVPLGPTDVSCVCTFVDRVDNTPRIPLATTNLFVLDKGTTNLPNIDYEIVYGDPVTVGGVTTITFRPNGRKLAMSGSSLVGNAVTDPTNLSHIAGAEIGTVDVHYLTTILAALLDGTDPITNPINIASRWAYSGSGVLAAPVFADATARDAAITSPQNGDIVYNTAVGLMQKYVGGSWVTDTAGGAVPNADETTAGKVELATLAEIQAGTSVGGTGARLVPPNDTLFTYINAAILNTGIVGEIRMRSGTAPSGWLVCEGGTIGNATSGGTARANADQAALFSYLWDNFANAQLAVTGGRGVSAVADFAANKAIAIPDLRGKVLVGLDSGTFNVNGKVGGEETHTLTTAEIPGHTHGLPTSTSGGGGLGYLDQTSSNRAYNIESTAANTGGGGAHNNIQPYFTSRGIIKY